MENRKEASTISDFSENVVNKPLRSASKQQLKEEKDVCVIKKAPSLEHGWKAKLTEAETVIQIGAKKENAHPLHH